jgi:hypothetical protein
MPSRRAVLTRPTVTHRVGYEESSCSQLAEEGIYVLLALFGLVRRVAQSLLIFKTDITFQQILASRLVLQFFGSKDIALTLALPQTNTAHGHDKIDPDSNHFEKDVVDAVRHSSIDVSYRHKK